MMMMNTKIVFLTMCAIAYLIGIVLTVVHVYRFTVTDAKSRGMENSKAMGLLATSGQRGSGMLLYLLKRKKYPVISISAQDKKLLSQCKVRTGIGVAVMVMSIAGFIAGLNLL